MAFEAARSREPQRKREREKASTKATSPSTKRREHARGSKNKLLGATARQRTLFWIRGTVALSHGCCPATRSEIVLIGRQIRRPRGPKARRLLMETFEGQEGTRGGGTSEKDEERGGRTNERTSAVGENKRWSLWAKGPVVVFPSEVEEEDERDRWSTEERIKRGCRADS